MLRKLVVLPVLLIVLAGCGGSSQSGESNVGESAGASTQSDSTNEQDAAVALPVEISDVVYDVSASNDGDIYVNFGFFATNPNPELISALPNIRATAKSKDGSILGTEEVGVFELYAGEITAADGLFKFLEEPATIEVEFVDATWVTKLPDSREPVSLTPSNVEFREDGSYYRVTGEITHDSPDIVDSVRVTAVLRDKEGGVVGYGTTYAGPFQAQSASPFELDAWFTKTPESVDVYAHKW